MLLVYFFNANTFSRWIDKALRVLLSVSLVCSQMLWAMQDPAQLRTDNTSGSSRRFTSAAELAEEMTSSQRRLLETHQHPLSSTLPAPGVETIHSSPLSEPFPSLTSESTDEQRTKPSGDKPEGTRAPLIKQQQDQASRGSAQQEGDTSIHSPILAEQPIISALPDHNIPAVSSSDVSESTKEFSASRLPREDSGEMSTIVPGDDARAYSVYGRSPSERHLQENSPLLATTPTEDLQRSAEKLKHIESTWHQTFRWANVDSLLQRMGYLCVLKRDDITFTDNEERRCCSRPLWLSGGAIPIASESARKRVLFVDGLKQGTEFVIFRTLHVGITALALYQLHNYLTETEPLICQGTPESKNVLGLIKFWEASDNRVLLGFFHDILSDQNHALSYLKYLLATPFVWGLGKGLWNIRNSALSHKDIAGEKVEDTHKAGILNDLGNDFSPGFKQDFLRWSLPLHPINRAFSSLMKNVLWNPSMSTDDQDAVFEQLKAYVIHTRGYTPLHALGWIMQLAYGMNERDIAFLRKNYSGLEETLLEDDLPDTLQHRRQLKVQAFHFLDQVASLSLKDNSHPIQRRINAIYANYLLWSLGAPRSMTGFTTMTAFKGLKLYVQASLIKKIVETFLEAKTCPQEPGVSMAGVEPWASDLTQECFNANVQAFNIIPGQPAETLIGNLDKYHFLNCTMDLDLSNKGLDGATVASIVSALINHNITINLLNLSGNNINTAGDFEVLFPSIQGISGLILSSNNIDNDEGVIAIGQSLGNLTRLTFFDLSDNEIGSEDNIAIGQALGNLARLTSLDLSGNEIGILDVDRPVAIYQSLGKLVRLTSLNLSSNCINCYGGNGTISLGRSLGNLTRLTSLDLSDNDIGNTEDGAIAIGQSLGYLTRLTSLDLSNNQIGNMGDNGTIAIGQSLGNLTRLTSLDLSGNGIGGDEGNGTIAIGQSLGNLTCLASLDLSNNEIGSTGDEGTFTIGKFLGNLTRLTYLDLSDNLIGWGGYNGAIAIGQSLRNLIRLTTLNIFSNRIAESGALSIGQSLNSLTNLTSLDLAGNLIGCSWGDDDILAIAHAFPSLHLLRTFNFLPQLCRVPNTSIIILNKALNHTLSSQLVPYLSSVADIESYCDSLPNSIQSVNLTSRIFWDNENKYEPMIVALMRCLQKFPNLESLDLSSNGFADDSIFGQFLGNMTGLISLDLSDNEIGCAGDEGIIAFKALENLVNLAILDLSNICLGEAANDGTKQTEEAIVTLSQSLVSLSRLTSLDLSNNFIGNSKNGSIAIGQSLGGLTLLTSLDLSGNSIGNKGDEGTRAIGNSLGNLINLTFLDLSGNDIGNTGDEGTRAIGNSLRRLTNLQILNLSGNGIGWIEDYGTRVIGWSLDSLTNLRSLDLSGNGIGYTGDEGTRAIGNSLGNLINLTFLDLSSDNIGYTGDEGTMAVGNSLRRLTNLQLLNLAGNNIGHTEDNGTVAIGQSLGNLTHLVSLNLGCVSLQDQFLKCNSIGSTGWEGPNAILAGLAQLNLNFSSFNLQGLTNISWPQSVDALQKLRSQAIQDSCQNSKCFGGYIQTSSGGDIQSADVSTQATSRRLMSLEQIIPSSFASSINCACPTQGQSIETCICLEGDSMYPRTLTEVHHLGAAAATGAVFAALPEALGDGLYLAGCVSSSNAKRIKLVTNGVLIWVSGSWIPVGASWVVSSGLQYMGVPGSQARIGGNTAAFLINTGYKLSPIGIASTALNFAAGRFGLWAEKKIMQKMYSTQQPTAQSSTIIH